MKTCTKCGQPGLFYKDKYRKDGLTPQCRTCMKTYSTRRRAAHPEKTQASVRAWEAAHPEKKAANLLRWKRNNPEKNRLSCAVVRHRRRARLAGLESTLTARQWREILEYFNNTCAYCLSTKVPLEQDHILPVARGGGTTAANVVPACSSCNLRKSDKPVFLMVA